MDRDTDTLFARTRQSKALSSPVDPGGATLGTLLRDFVNVDSSSDLTLLIGWIIGALQPQGPYPILVLSGEQGSAKSTTTRLLKRLIDPAITEIRSLPPTERDLVIAAQGSWVLAFDNLSGMSGSMSDALSRLATGGGIGARKLYTDGDEFVLEASRPVILNGIEIVATRSDLLDRAIVVELPAIRAARRRLESEYWVSLEAALPRILGALYGAVSTSLRRQADLPLTGWPRMADFARWVTAAEPALGWPDRTFLDAYARRHTAIGQSLLEDSPLAQTLIRLVSATPTWQGSATALLEEVHRQFPEARDRDRLPTSPRKLRADLDRIIPDMRRLGFEVGRDRDSSPNRSRIIWVRRETEQDIPTMTPAPHRPLVMDDMDGL